MTIVTMFDPHCQDLAEHFLAEEPFTNGRHVAIHKQRSHLLSLAIQQAIEDWTEEHPFPEESNAKEAGNSVGGDRENPVSGRAGDKSAVSRRSTP